jgi:hypothetical protein
MNENDYTGMRAMPKDFPLKFVEKTDAEKLAEFKKALRESTIREYEYQKRIKELQSLTEAQSKREAELVEALKGLVACIDETRGMSAFKALELARNILASSEGK